MLYYAIKLILSAGLIVIISEISKRLPWLGALLASLPIVSVLAFVWLYVDTQDTTKVSRLSLDIFWMVLPSLALFLLLPWLLKQRFHFYLALGFSCLATAVLYTGVLWLMNKSGSLR